MSKRHPTHNPPPKKDLCPKCKTHMKNIASKRCKACYERETSERREANKLKDIKFGLLPDKYVVPHADKIEFDPRPWDEIEADRRTQSKETMNEIIPEPEPKPKPKPKPEPKPEPKPKPKPEPEPEPKSESDIGETTPDNQYYL